MQHEFWHQRWQENRIGFHQFMPSPLMVSYFNGLNLKPNSRVFVPLSGKTLDICRAPAGALQISQPNCSGCFN